MGLEKKDRDYDAGWLTEKEAEFRLPPVTRFERRPVFAGLEHDPMAIVDE